MSFRHRIFCISAFYYYIGATIKKFTHKCKNRPTAHCKPLFLSFTIIIKYKSGGENFAKKSYQQPQKVVRAARGEAKDRGVKCKAQSERGEKSVSQIKGKKAVSVARCEAEDRGVRCEAPKERNESVFPIKGKKAVRAARCKAEDRGVKCKAQPERERKECVPKSKIKKQLERQDARRKIGEGDERRSPKGSEKSVSQIKGKKAVRAARCKAQPAGGEGAY
ncbi:MAG: hypothetical protein J1F29_07950 [Lentimicrobiaceae bacterium]|nr:hypothetical protein [Lentimicrobiaceae bacterium]